VICLWSSFGWFDDATNGRVLAAMARRLAAGGVIVLDVYQPAFLARHHGLRVRREHGIEVRERNAAARPPTEAEPRYQLVLVRCDPLT
jgi:hypothetical protein